MLKACFYFLLLANVVYFLWDLTQPPERKVRSSSHLPGLKILPQVTTLGSKSYPATSAELSYISSENLDSEANEDEANVGHFVDYPHLHEANTLVESERALGEKGDSVAPILTETNESNSEVKQLRQLSDLKQSSVIAEETPTMVGTASAAKTESALTCMHAGYLETQEQAETALTVLEASGVVLVPRVMALPTDVPKGYWVLYPTLGDYSKAEAKVSELRQSGVTDLWLFRKGPRRGEISLGLFKSHARALQQANMLKDKGIPAEIQRWTTAMPRFWLVFETRASPRDITDLLQGEATAAANNWVVDVVEYDQCSTTSTEE